MYRKAVLFPLLFASVALFAQSGAINVSVYDGFTHKPLPAKVTVTSSGAEFVGEGSVSVSNLAAGNYTLKISSDGYEDGFLNDISALPDQNVSFTVELTKRSEKTIEEVVISRKVYKTTSESPVSLRNITSEEVQKSAGANRDVSKAMLSFPGVGTTATFRNDLFIRGGSSAENKFYVDGIEVPVVNHFQTQGASGGPKGILTVDFIRDVDFYSGAFPASRNGALSSLFEFSLKQARRDHMGYKGIVGFDDLQLMADGPLSKDQSWSGLFSVRKSNLQFLFKAMGVPFLPSYSDAVFKVSKKFSSGDELYFLGIGAVDTFKFNKDAEPTLRNLTLIERLPVSPQWNYALGAGYRHQLENGSLLLTWSRNMLNNEAKKYLRNIETPENLLLDYQSRESENKLRADRNFRLGDYQLSAGANVNFAQYTNDSFVRSVAQSGQFNENQRSELNLTQYGFYLQAARKFLDGSLDLSAGLRVDGSDYSANTRNLLEQFSPRISARYLLTGEWALNFNAGIYRMLPSYSALGFTQDGALVNRQTLKYLSNAQLVGGVEYNAKNHLRITAEGYYKKYRNYPFSLRNQISLANLGGDFGVVGNDRWTAVAPAKPTAWSCWRKSVH